MPMIFLLLAVLLFLDEEGMKQNYKSFLDESPAMEKMRREVRNLSGDSSTCACVCQIVSPNRPDTKLIPRLHHLISVKLHLHHLLTRNIIMKLILQRSQGPPRFGINHLAARG